MLGGINRNTPNVLKTIETEFCLPATIDEHNKAETKNQAEMRDMGYHESIILLSPVEANAISYTKRACVQLFVEMNLGENNPE